MTAATIVVDPHGLTLRRAEAVAVERPTDYVTACLAIRAAIHGGSPVAAYVRDPNAAIWLKRLANAYGNDHVTVQEVNARDVLAERWAVSIPADVSDADIIASNLLDVRVAARDGQTFWTAILEHFCDPVLTSNAFPRGNLAALLNRYAAKPWDANLQKPLVNKALRDRLALWERGTHDPATVEVIQLLARDRAELRRYLVWYGVLHTYPVELAKDTIGPMWETLQRARLETADLTITPEDVASLVPMVSYYLTAAREKVITPKDLRSLLEAVSGQLLVEFGTINSILRQHPDWLTVELLAQVDRCFRPIHQEVESLLASQRRLVPPRRTSAPDPAGTWTAAQWLAWVRDDYMPYYAWLDAQSRSDDEMAAYAISFADWYYNHFVSLRSGAPEHFAFNALYQDRERMTAPTAVALVILLDNVNFAYQEEIRRLFLEVGLAQRDCRPVLSLVPTMTQIGKPSVVAGVGDHIDSPDEPYAELVQAAWGKTATGKKATYLPNVGQLRALTALDHDIYFLNFLQTDIILHEDSDQTGESHADRMHDCLRSLAQAIAEFSKRFKIEGRLVVSTISDHGSTRIAKDKVNVLDKSFYKGIALDKHHRFLALDEGRLATLPQVVHAQCYVIDRKTFQTNRDYLVAKGYHRFADVSESYYVHGGLTPEEVVVPFARFEPALSAPEPPTVLLRTVQFRVAVTSRVGLAIGNPNATPLESVTVQLVDASADDVHIASIAPKSEVAVELTTKFQKRGGAGPTRPLKVRVRFEFQGRSFGPQDQTFEITVKSLMEVTDDVEF